MDPSYWAEVEALRGVFELSIGIQLIHLLGEYLIVPLAGFLATELFLPTEN